MAHIDVPKKWQKLGNHKMATTTPCAQRQQRQFKAYGAAHTRQKHGLRGDNLKPKAMNHKIQRNGKQKYIVHTTHALYPSHPRRARLSHLKSSQVLFSSIPSIAKAFSQNWGVLYGRRLTHHSDPC